MLEINKRFTRSGDWRCSLLTDNEIEDLLHRADIFSSEDFGNFVAVEGELKGLRFFLVSNSISDRHMLRCSAECTKLIMTHQKIPMLRLV